MKLYKLFSHAFVAYLAIFASLGRAQGGFRQENAQQGDPLPERPDLNFAPGEKPRLKDLLHPGISDQDKKTVLSKWVEFAFNHNKPQEAVEAVLQMDSIYSDAVQDQPLVKSSLYLAHITGKIYRYKGKVTIPHELGDEVNPYLFELFCSLYPEYSKNRYSVDINQLNFNDDVKKIFGNLKNGLNTFRQKSTTYDWTIPFDSDADWMQDIARQYMQFLFLCLRNALKADWKNHLKYNNYSMVMIDERVRSIINLLKISRQFNISNPPILKSVAEIMMEFHLVFTPNINKAMTPDHYIAFLESQLDNGSKTHILNELNTERAFITVQWHATPLTKTMVSLSAVILFATIIWKKVINKTKTVLGNKPLEVLVDEVEAHLRALEELTKSLLKTVKSSQNIEKKDSSDKMKVMESLLHDMAKKQEASLIIFEKIQQAARSQTPPIKVLVNQHRIAMLFIKIQTIMLESMWINYGLYQIELANRELGSMMANQSRIKLAANLRNYEETIHKKESQLQMLFENRECIFEMSEEAFTSAMSCSIQAKEYALLAKYYYVHSLAVKIDNFLKAAPDDVSLISARMFFAEMLENIQILESADEFSSDKKKELSGLRVKKANQIKAAEEISTRNLTSKLMSSSIASTSKPQKSFTRNLFVEYFSSDTFEKTAMQAERKGLLKEIHKKINNQIKKRKVNVRIDTDFILQYIIDNREILLDIVDGINEKTTLADKLAEIILQRHVGMSPQETTQDSLVKNPVATTVDKTDVESLLPMPEASTSASATQRAVRWVDTKTPRKLREIFEQANGTIVDLSSALAQHDELYFDDQNMVSLPILQHAYINSLLLHIIYLDKELNKLEDHLPLQHPIVLYLAPLRRNLRQVRNGLAHQGNQKGNYALLAEELTRYCQSLSLIKMQTFVFDAGLIGNSYSVSCHNIETVVAELNDSDIYKTYKTTQSGDTSLTDEIAFVASIDMIKALVAAIENLLSFHEINESHLLCLQRGLYVEIALLGEQHKDNHPQLSNFRNRLFHQKTIDHHKLQQVWGELQQFISETVFSGNEQAGMDLEPNHISRDKGKKRIKAD